MFFWNSLAFSMIQRMLAICWHIECSTFTALSFRIWNSSTGIPSSPLALFIVMLSKAHLTSHSFIIHFNLPFAVFFKPCVILKHAIQFPNIWDFSKGLSVNDIWFNFLVFKEYTLYDLNLLKIFCFMDWVWFILINILCALEKNVYSTILEWRFF